MEQQHITDDELTELERGAKVATWDTVEHHWSPQTVLALVSDLRASRQRIAELETARDGETAEFNAGHDAATRGEGIDKAEAEYRATHPHDYAAFRLGYGFGAWIETVMVAQDAAAVDAAVYETARTLSAALDEIAALKAENARLVAQVTELETQLKHWHDRFTDETQRGDYWQGRSVYYQAELNDARHVLAQIDAVAMRHFPPMMTYVDPVQAVTKVVERKDGRIAELVARLNIYRDVFRRVNRVKREYRRGVEKAERELDEEYQIAAQLLERAERAERERAEVCDAVTVCLSPTSRAALDALGRVAEGEVLACVTE